MRKLAALVAIGVASLLVRDAAAQRALVQDGSDFRIDLGSIGACMIEPREMRRADLCAGMTPDAAHVPETTSTRRVLALGVFHPRAGGTAVVGVYRITARSTEPRTQADAARLMEDAVVGVQKTVPAGAHARSSDAQIVTVQNGAKAVRGDIDVDGLPASEAALQHIAMAMINTTSGAYAISISGEATARAETDAVLDAILPTAFVREPAKGMNLASVVGFAIGFGGVFVLLIIGVVVALVVSSRKPPPPPPHGWPR